MTDLQTPDATVFDGGPATEPDAKNLYDAFAKTAGRIGDLLAVKAEAEDLELTWSQLARHVRAAAGGLNSLGVTRGENVGLLMNNLSAFYVCDMAVVSLGAVPFSIYQTSSPEQITYLLEDSSCRTIFVEESLLPALLKARESVDTIEHIIVVDKGGKGGTTTLEELEAADPDFDPAPIAAETTLDDPLTLIYTSGTTGPPKGVVLTHNNLLTMSASVMESRINMRGDGTSKVISWLPAAHIAERAANYYTPCLVGLQIHVCPDPRRIVEFLPKVNPTWFFAVPRIWEKLKAGLEAQLATLPEEQRAGAEAGLAAAIKKVQLEQKGEEIPEELAAAVTKADEQLFSHLRKSLGLDEYLAVSVGAAPTSIEVLEFFHAIGIKVGELWGLSETCGVVTINPPEAIRIGTVGTPVGGAKVKLAEDGEILNKSPFIMKEYRNRPDKTAEAIDEEGWLHTGDIGTIDEDGYVTIIDRKKELIINAAGKNMSPANIEAHIKAASPLIGQCVAIGDSRPYNVALIVLDPDFGPVWASQNGLERVPMGDLADNADVIAAVQAGIDAANAKLARVEQIKKFKIVPNEWLPGGDELTPTMKLKRKPISAKYEAEIEALYTT